MPRKVRFTDAGRTVEIDKPDGIVGLRSSEPADGGVGEPIFFHQHERLRRTLGRFAAGGLALCGDSHCSSGLPAILVYGRQPVIAAGNGTRRKRLTHSAIRLTASSISASVFS